MNSFITADFELSKAKLGVLCFDKGEHYQDTIDVIIADGYIDIHNCRSRRTYCIHPFLGVLGYFEADETYSKCHEFDFTDINGFRYYRIYASRESMSLLKTLSAQNTLMESLDYTNVIPWRFIRFPF